MSQLLDVREIDFDGHNYAFDYVFDINGEHRTETHFNKDLGEITHTRRRAINCLCGRHDVGTWLTK